mmetsp:Transcript_108033/g.150713  ORF Transcript_108033/g.150713 Transcript_108033/m.150713 type:complete len:241 (+) Transcript_108033:1417-2139(+)
MEEAKTEQNGSNLDVLIIDIFLREVGPSSLHVGSQTGGGLIGKLDASLQNTVGDGVGRFGRQIESESGVTRGLLLSLSIQHLLELNKPSRHQMNVLKHDPMSILETGLQSLHSDLVLTLTQSNLEEGLSYLETLLLGELLDINNGIGTRRQNEEDGSDVSGIIVRRRQNLQEGILGIQLHKLFTLRQGVSNEIRGSRNQSVRSQASQNKQLLERHGIQFFPVKGQLGIFRIELVVPILES